MNRCAGNPTGRVCGNPTDGYLCHDCTTALRVELTDVPELLAELDITLSRQDRLTDPTNRTRTGGERPLPYKPHVTPAVWLLHHTLHTWALDHGAPENSTTPGLAQHLLVNLHHIQNHPDAGRLVDEITHAIHHAREAIDRPDDRRQFLGPCDAELDDRSHCREEIYGVPWRDHATCDSCGARHHIATRQQWMRDIAHDHLGTSTEIAGYLRTTGIHCTPDVIRGYVRRGRLAPATDTNPPLYRMADVLAALQDRYRHHNPRTTTKQAA